MINLFQPSLGDEELQEVSDVFESNWIGRGKKVAELEAEFARLIGVPARNVIATTCATEALFQSLPALNISRGNRVIVPTIHFIGAANAVTAAGAELTLCDVDPHTLNATVETVAPHITPRTKAFMWLDYGGFPPSDADDLRDFLNHNRVKIIEDAAPAIGARHRDLFCGSQADVGIWSLDAMKIISSGDGGLMYIKNTAAARRARNNMYLGMDSESGLSSASRDRWWEFSVVDCDSRRAIMNDITAGIALAQLCKLFSYIARRKHIWFTYYDFLARLDWLRCPPLPDESVNPSYYLFWIQTDHRDRLATYLRDRDIYTTYRYHPIHLAYDAESAGQFPAAEWAARTTLCLPLHQSLSNVDVINICETIEKFKP